MIEKTGFENVKKENINCVIKYVFNLESIIKIYQYYCFCVSPSVRHICSIVDLETLLDSSKIYGSIR